MLTASISNDGPVEPEDVWPTYANMVKAFQQLTQTVQPGDQVYIQYSGHGGRTTTMFPALKGETAFDEGLVPLDIGDPDNPDARYLRDVEMHNLLQDLVDKEVRLTVVFDCCRSGGARATPAARASGASASPTRGRTAQRQRSGRHCRPRGTLAGERRGYNAQPQQPEQLAARTSGLHATRRVPGQRVGHGVPLRRP